MARAHGFLDPVQFLAKLRGFAQPSEVAEPIELLRAGVLFHARGLINTKAIQNNLDWVWPYWVERQFNPNDESFIPRAFSFSHINLTHRNWTAVGLPDVPYYPIVDPRGLVTPLFDGWSLDFWLINENGKRLLPSKLEQVEQDLFIGEELFVRTRLAENDWEIVTEISMKLCEHHPHCVIRVKTKAPAQSHLAVVVRPYNPEGISFVEAIRWQADRQHWLINEKDKIIFGQSPEKCLFSNYKQGDVLHALCHGTESSEIKCPVAMATGAALFPVAELQGQPLEIQVPIYDELKSSKQPTYAKPPSWPEETAAFSQLEIPDAKFQRLYELSISTLILHSPGEVYPGPYTYKRFWYRDAAFIINAMISLGARSRCKRALDLFPKNQTLTGYFCSQDGEWDSNGEAIWILHRYLKLTGEIAPEPWLAAIEKGARWIMKKRLARDLLETHAGLLPAGFSAEHLGPNDFYYWDNFWGVSGLRCAAELLSENAERATRNA
ncbi:MAG: hypothetical protein M3Y82_03880, partial [Verrucomicrobiota bacterium]|nr:hypothetical protein [Verrucomicrobiota bacterium]